MYSNQESTLMTYDPSQQPAELACGCLWMFPDGVQEESQRPLCHTVQHH